MYKILDRVNGTEDLKKLNIREKQELAEDIRSLIIETVSKNGRTLSIKFGSCRTYNSIT